jgi:20S proteasome subunit beta 2
LESVSFKKRIEKFHKHFLFRYQGHIGAYLVLGGYDHDGPHLYSVAAHGSTDKVPFTAMGSGMLSATSVLVIFAIE